MKQARMNQNIKYYQVLGKIFGYIFFFVDQIILEKTCFCVVSFIDSEKMRFVQVRLAL